MREFLCFLDGSCFHPLRLVNLKIIAELRELMAILGLVDIIRRCAPDFEIGLLATHGQSVWDLPAHGDDQAIGILLLVDVEHSLEREFVEV